MVRPTRRAAALVAFSFTVATAGATPPPPVDARDGTVRETVAVPYGDLDLTTDAGARVLYARLTSAAGRVCGFADARELSLWVRVRHCREQALAAAVARIDAPRLTALHRTARPPAA
jgi:UrcA family protein